MKTKRFALIAAAALAALTLIGAPSAAFADEPLHLPAPTQNADCTVDVPEVDGVFYGVYDYTNQLDGSGWEGTADGYGFEAGDDILVIASDDSWGPLPEGTTADGGVFDSTGDTAGWWFTNDCIVTVTAKAPVFTDPAGAGNLTASYADTDAYFYTERRYSNGKLQVNAYAKPGYVLTGTTQWSKLDR